VRQNAMRFEAHTILVTGAASGIGRATATFLANEGADVIAADLSAVGWLDGMPRSSAARISPMGLDVADPPAIEALVQAVVKQRGHIDGLVNCAGIVQHKAMLELTSAEWDRVVDVNLRGSFFCLQAVGRVMLAGTGGAIVNISSVAGRIGWPFATHYSASKAGVLSITKSAAMALAPTIRVNAICPGIVDTPMWQQLDRESSDTIGTAPGEAFRQISGSMPLGRAAAPEEISSVVAFLLSDDARYITGQAINVDGGMEMT